MTKDTLIYSQGKSALTVLMGIRKRGAYRVIRDPEGVVSMWAIEGTERGPFTVTFADRGRVSAKLEVMSPDFVKAFVEYVNKVR